MSSAKIKVVKLFNLYLLEYVCIYCAVGSKGVITGGSFKADVSCMLVELKIRMSVHICDNFVAIVLVSKIFATVIIGLVEAVCCLRIDFIVVVVVSVFNLLLLLS